MIYQEKTKEEFIKELQKLKQENDLLKTSYSKNIFKFKQVEDALSRQKDALVKLNKFSIGLSKLTLEDNLEAFIVKQLKVLTGAKAAVFSEYSHIEKTTTVKYIDIDSRLLKKVISLLGQDVYTLHSEVSEESYDMMTSEIIGIRKTLFEVSFGTIPRPVGTAIQRLLKADRFIGLAYIIEGKLYGTSLLAMGKGQSDPPREILENFIFLAGVSLRRKLAEQLLKESNEWLNEAQKLAHIGVWNWNPDTDNVTWTDELYSIAGLDPKLPEPTYQEHSRLFTPQSWELLKTGVEKAMGTGESYQSELELIRPNGDTRYINAFGGAKFDSKGLVNRLFGTIQDITERKHIEEVLKLNETLFREYYNNMKSGSAIFTVLNDGSKGSDYIIKKINRIGLKMEGKTLEEVVGKRFVDIRPTIDSYGLIPIMKKVWETGESDIFPTRIYLDERSSNYYENYIFKLPSGEVVTLYSDVTDSKKAEETLRDSEERYRLLVEGSPDAIAIHANGKFIFVNPAGAKLIGANSPQELIGKPILDVVHPNSRTQVIERLSLVSEGKKAPLFEEKFVKLDGSVIDVEVIGIPFTYEGQPAIQVVVRDITERKQAEKKQFENEERLRDIIFSIGDWVWEVDENGIFTYSSQKGSDLFGTSTEKIIGKTPFGFMHADEAKRVGEIFSELTAKKEPIRDLENWCKGKNGERICLMTNGVPFFDSHGNLKGYRGVDKDITEFKKNQAALEQMNEGMTSLYQRLENVRESERAEISRNIHDQLGQSLTSLKFDLGTLIDKTERGSKENLKLSGMIDMVTQIIRNVQRISSELRPPALDELGLSAAMEWYCEDFIERTGLQLRMELDNVQTRDMNKNLALYRVLQESLTNVIRHSSAKNVLVKLFDFGQDIFLIIKDDGIGISQDKIVSFKSLGILGMLERTRQYGGDVEITNPDKKGTEVKARLSK